MKRGRSVRLPVVVHEPYVNRESWMFVRLPLVAHKNYVDGYGKLPEEREGDGKTGNLPINL